MEKAKYKHIIWDWNGTLFEDRDISLKTVNYILEKRGMPPINIEQYYSYVETPITKFYEHLFDMSKVSFEDIGKDYYYAYHIYCDKLTVSDGLKELLKKLSDAGCVQKLVSGYEHAYLCSMTERCGVRMYFSDINGADNRRAESKLDRIKDAIAQSGSAPEESVIIGDTEHEYDIASELGVPCILVGWGHRPGKELAKCGCPCAENIKELKKLLFYD